MLTGMTGLFPLVSRFDATNEYELMPGAIVQLNAVQFPVAAVTLADAQNADIVKLNVMSVMFDSMVQRRFWLKVLHDASAIWLMLRALTVHTACCRLKV